MKGKPISKNRIPLTCLAGEDSNLYNIFEGKQASLLKLPTDTILLPVLKEHHFTLHMRREDLIHPLLSGNKYRKLKYNVQEAIKRKVNKLITFGGAYSNHIPATAYIAKENGLQAIGIIRGEELSTCWFNNPTLSTAHKLGMTFKFIPREEYRKKEEAQFLKDLLQLYGPSYIIPEGGTNALAIKGCEEILETTDEHYDLICCAVGTGGTLAGLSNAAKSHQHVLGFPALKGDFLQKDICKFATKKNWSLCNEYHFGGYAKINTELVTFINNFREETGVPLDPVYTAKMMYGILDKVARNEFKEGSRILAIHTGGLQGVEGMNSYLKKKKLPLLTV
ncbi:1-aminocyclopropane-1-carboxylate deaminase/D-cysteine desulfhydrase [Muriicola sp.]|uniref:1-aminocyclopropane-1-carboxylate deaminase/D-cysteine desulfhydrase n=1 Tax=Muriicola sp. TaxID=2020856 RepID=UPI003C792014